MEKMDCAELQCCVCDEDYSDHYLPCNLNCGHSVCLRCVKLLIPISRRCPECRETFPQTQALKLPINYPLLRISRLVSHQKTGPAPYPPLVFPLRLANPDPVGDAGKCSIHGSRLFFMCISCGVWICSDCAVVDHPDPPRGKCYILSVKDAIDKVKSSHTDCIDRYISETTVIRDKLNSHVSMYETGVKNLKPVVQDVKPEEKSDIEKVDKDKDKDKDTSHEGNLEENSDLTKLEENKDTVQEGNAKENSDTVTSEKGVEANHEVGPMENTDLPKLDKERDDIKEVNPKENPDLVKLEMGRNAIRAKLTALDEVKKSLREARDKMRDSNTPADISVSMALSSKCQEEFEEILEEEKTREIPDILDIILRHKGKNDIKELVKEGTPVYASRKHENKDEWAKVVFADNRLHLYSLKSEAPPEDGIFLPYDLVRKQLPVASPSFFLEIGWGNETKEFKGRVYIRCFGDTAFGRQAVLLCSGEKRHCYRNTCFYNLTKKEEEPFILQGGDYERNNGSGGHSIVNDIVRSSDYNRDIEVGLVCAWPVGENWHLGTFNIYLSDFPGLKECCGYAFVEEGLDVLMEAAKVTPITNVLVMDCGVVLSHEVPEITPITNESAMEYEETTSS